jgi:RNA polymerase sigma-70 factor (ECF subfamily)
MKGGRSTSHSPFVVNGLSVMPANVGAKTAPAAETPELDLLSIHAQHADFVWLTLQRLGVRDADVEDLLQEVFVVVHRRLHTFDGRSRMSSWLYGISVRVAAAHRRRAFQRREQIGGVPETADRAATPEEAVAARQAQARLRAVLDAMDLEKRALFVMFEIDEVPCETIADFLGVPVGTVYSRLHAARKDFEAALRRVEARASGRRGGAS